MTSPDHENPATTIPFLQELAAKHHNDAAMDPLPYQQPTKANIKPLMDWFSQGYPTNSCKDLPLFFIASLCPENSDCPKLHDCEDEADVFHYYARTKALSQLMETYNHPEWRATKSDRVQRLELMCSSEVVNYRDASKTDEEYWKTFDQSIEESLGGLDVDKVVEKFTKDFGIFSPLTDPIIDVEGFKSEIWNVECALLVLAGLQYPTKEAAQFLFDRVCKLYPVIGHLSKLPGHPLQKWKLAFEQIEPHWSIPILMLRFAYTLYGYDDVVIESLNRQQSR